jgi:hypothetical protein
MMLIIARGGTQYAWSSAKVIAPLVLGVVLLGAFIYVEIRVTVLPIIPSKPFSKDDHTAGLIHRAVHIFKNSTVASANGGTFFTGFMFYCNLYYVNHPATGYTGAMLTALAPTILSSRPLRLSLSL